ncbi:YdaS family helix-turn-helix protein [Pseudomonas fluorescens]|uniref:YdaS family helix-turn-helix protein n=1 Tax=Pseudomonas fluorescens TaxID=294 RepID=UPI0013792AC0|nr:YdaS family helix-turn-helix protein [Pseudomonas fluorescens]
MNAIKKAVDAVGGASAAAKLCGVSARAINKWVAAGRLPRTEYTGETRHAENLERGAGGVFTASWLKQSSVLAYQQSGADGNSTDSRTVSSAPDVPVYPSSSA